VATGHGLTVALESLAARAPVPVELNARIDGDRFQEGLEVAAYYVVGASSGGGTTVTARIPI
jgi:hypothetical protein